jgi:hypothetical protein
MLGKTKDGTLTVPMATRLTPEEAALVTKETERRSAAAGVPVRPAAVIRALLMERLGDQAEAA